jgi:hypothetical protein
MKADLQQEFAQLGKSQTATQALKDGLKEGIGAFFAGLGKAIDTMQSSPALNDLANHGRTELAAALYSGQSNAFVMYHRSQPEKDQPKMEADKPSVEVEQPEIKQSRGIHM